jgi:hypothetical protein
MGWLDKAKIALGIIDAGDVEDEGPPRAQKRVTLGKDDGRPSLDGIEAAPQETLDDVLAARDAGDLEEMRSLLKRIDRGRGLRVVLRAAAALEANDEAELNALLPNVAACEPAWKLPLQVAAVVEDREKGAALRVRAERLGAPPWALAWMDACSSDEETRRRGLVELVFLDPALARTVAARDLQIAGVVADADAGHRFVSFAHGRDCIRRFGSELVADTLSRATRQA